MKGFNVRTGVCAECGEAQTRPRSSTAPKRVAQPEKPQKTPAGPKLWKCPNCLKRVEVASGALVDHQNARGRCCAGSRYEPPQKSADALDYRVTGSFEGGRR